MFPDVEYLAGRCGVFAAEQDAESRRWRDLGNPGGAADVSARRADEFRTLATIMRAMVTGRAVNSDEYGATLFAAGERYPNGLPAALCLFWDVGTEAAQERGQLERMNDDGPHARGAK